MHAPSIRRANVHVEGPDIYAVRMECCVIVKKRHFAAGFVMTGFTSSLEENKDTLRHLFSIQANLSSR